ncbi:uncharacterized protein [Periplaneta americana]|uniref:uncharacterized protein isoform X3 n=1 Tax=Periplaneta americana TaxID=6978 RepID=UPI0037E785DE
MHSVLVGWTKDQVRTLIEAYREETCIYAVQSPNYYHNKRMRIEALKRVYAAVWTQRLGTTEKDCARKFHNLRHQYNVENSRVSTSIKSGVGAGNVYAPSLWYFHLMMFLGVHIGPRKSRTSLIGPTLYTEAQMDETEETQTHNESDAPTVYHGDDNLDETPEVGHQHSRSLLSPAAEECANVQATTSIVNTAVPTRSLSSSSSSSSSGSGVFLGVDHVQDHPQRGGKYILDREHMLWLLNQ